MEESDGVLGDPEAVKAFVVNALARFNVTVPARDGVLTLSSLGQLPEAVQAAVPDKAQWRVTFVSPAPERMAYLGRNHPFVAELARYLLEEALTRGGEARATRCGVIRTSGVERRTAVLLLRLRYMLQEPQRSPMLAEEVYVCGVRGSPPDRLDWLPDGEALGLLKTASVIGNISIQERREVLEEALGWWDGLQPGLEGLIRERSRRLEDAHRRVRKASDLAVRGTGVRPYLPPDLLGLLVLLPVPKGVAR